MVAEGPGRPAGLLPPPGAGPRRCRPFLAPRRRPSRPRAAPPSQPPLTATGSPAPPSLPSPPALTLEVGVGVLVAAVGLLLAVGLGLHGLPVEADHPAAAAGRLLVAGIPQAGEVVGGEAQQVGRPMPQHLHRVALQQLGEARRDLDAHGAGDPGGRRLPPSAAGCGGGGLGASLSAGAN